MFNFFQENKGSRRLHDTIALIRPYLLLALAMIILFGAGILFNYRMEVSNARQKTIDRMHTISEEVFARVTSYKRACDVLASSNTVQSFSREYRKDTLSVAEAISSLKIELGNVAGIADFPYDSLEVYYPGEQVLVTSGNVYRGEESCRNHLEDYGGSALSSAISGMRSVNAWKICYDNGSAWLIRQLSVSYAAKAFIILEWKLSELVPIRSDEGFVIIGDDERLLYFDEIVDSDETASSVRSLATEDWVSLRGGNYYIRRCIFSVLHTEVLVALSVGSVLAENAELIPVTTLLAVICIISLLLLFRTMYKRVVVPFRYLSETGWLDTETESFSDIFSLARNNLTALKNQAEAAEEEKKLLLRLGAGELLQQVHSLPLEASGGIAERCLSLCGILPGHSYIVLGFFPLSRYGSSAGVPGEAVYDELFPGRVGMITVLGRYAVVISACMEGEDPAANESTADRVREYYQERFGMPLAVTDPLTGHSPEDLHILIQRTVNNLDYLYFWQKGQIEESSEENVKELLSFFKSMRNLINRLDSRDYSGAKEIFDRIMEDNLPRNAEGFQITKYRIYGMLEMLVNAISDDASLGVDAMNDLDFEHRLYEVDTLPAFRETTEDIFLRLVEIRRESDSSIGTRERIEQIKAYIDEHFTDNDLTVTSVAERFTLNSSYLSREFKHITGLNMLEYIHRLRIARVKQLLPDHSVKDSALEAGFWDTQSLVRVFKKYEGITPGEFKQSIK